MSTLAIKGGSPVRKKLFPGYNPITKDEIAAAVEVLETGKLSGFLAGEKEGGKKVRKFEELWADAHNANYCVSVNSATSGLFAAIGAAGLKPGDEVIVSPYTMSASATCCFGYGAVPVFADIQDDIYNMDPKAIEKLITPLTKAIVVVHIFGNPADMDPIMDLARKYNLVVIEDCAQAPLAKYKGRFVGTIGDMGVFSLNIHKHIHTGEGGMITTNNPHLKDRLQLIRNHGECYSDLGAFEDMTNLWGHNFRLTELQAAIGISQLKRLDKLIDERINNCEYIAEKLGQIPGIISPVVYENCKHSYYVQAFKYNSDIVGVSRDIFVEAVAAELPFAENLENVGKLIGAGYVKPNYLNPFYLEKKGICSSFNDPRYKGNVNYYKGLCPVCERMHFSELFTHEYMRPPMTREDLDDFCSAFEKVYDFRHELVE